MNDKYIFSIPKAHISALVYKVYPTFGERHSLMNQECGEFLQAFSKYDLARDSHVYPNQSLEMLDNTREKLIEEMTHVLVCFGIIAWEANITQDDINREVAKKAIDGVDYPFPVKKEYTKEDIIKALRICSKPSDGKSPRCSVCLLGESDDVTLVCRDLLTSAQKIIEETTPKRVDPNA